MITIADSLVGVAISVGGFVYCIQVSSDFRPRWGRLLCLCGVVSILAFLAIRLHHILEINDVSRHTVVSESLLVWALRCMAVGFISGSLIVALCGQKNRRSRVARVLYGLLNRPCLVVPSSLQTPSDCPGGAPTDSVHDEASAP